MNRATLFKALAAVTALVMVPTGIYYSSQTGGKSNKEEYSQSTESEEQSTTETDKSEEKESYRLVMYYSDWSIWGGQGNYYPYDLPTEYYTHLNYAFLDFDSAGNLLFVDQDAAVGASLNQSSVVWGEVNAGILPVLRSERAENPNLRLGFSIGGWSKSGDFSTMANNDTTRQNFVAQLMKVLEYSDFDFIDIDWEYPAVYRQPDYTDNQNDEGTPSAIAEDKENYIKLLTEIRLAMEEQGERLGKTYELSVALPLDQEKLELGIDVEAMFQVVDFANLMSYDARGAFDDVTGHHSPLYGNSADPFYSKGYSIDQAVEYLVVRGATTQQIVVGAAFYSRGWENVENLEIVEGLPALFATASAGIFNADTSASLGAYNDLAITMGDGGISGGVWAYRNFEQLHETYPNLVEYWDDVAKAPYLYNGSAFFTYDNPQSLTEKAQYVKQHNLGGIIAWQASNDAVTDVPAQRDLLTKVIYDNLFEEEERETYPIVTTALDLAFSLSPYENGVEFTLKNLERAEETTALLRALELQKETVQMPMFYFDLGGAGVAPDGYEAGAVYPLEGLTIVDLTTVYEFRNILQGGSATFRLSGITEEDVKSVSLVQRVTALGAEISCQTLYLAEGISEPSRMPTTSQEGILGNVGENTQETVPESTVSPSSKPVGTLENPVAWSREAEATGSYVPHSFVFHQGLIYQQVAEGTLWWDEPNPSSTVWAVVGEMEGYAPPEPSPWSREEEATGAYTSGTKVTHNGKTYLQISGEIAWWCEPSTDETIWQELPD